MIQCVANKCTVPSGHSQFKTIVFAPVSAIPSIVQFPLTQAQMRSCGWSEDTAPSESWALKPNEKSAKFCLADGIVKVKFKSLPIWIRFPLAGTPSIVETVNSSSSVALKLYTASSPVLTVKILSPCSVGGLLTVIKNNRKKSFKVQLICSTVAVA